MELLNKLSNNEIETHSIDIISTNCKIPQCKITAAQSQHKSKAGGVTKILKLKISAKVMLTLSGDIKDRLINGLIVKDFEITENVVSTTFTEFDDVDAGRNLISTNRFAIQNNWVPIKKFDTSIFIGNS